MKIECELVEKYKIEVIDEGGNIEVLIYDDTAKGAYQRYLEVLYGPGYNGRMYDMIETMERVEVIIYNNHIVDYKTISKWGENLLATFPYENSQYWSGVRADLTEKMKARMKIEEAEREIKAKEAQKIRDQEYKEWQERQDKINYERLKKKFEGG